MDETVEITRRREEHYACGCSTTQIETVPGTTGLHPLCAGHGKPMIKTITTNEYLNAEQKRGYQHTNRSGKHNGANGRP